MAAPISIPFAQTIPLRSAPLLCVADTDTFVTVTNASGAAIQVIAFGATDDDQTDLGEIAAGQTLDVMAPAGTTTLGFAQNDDWLGDTYAVTGDLGQVVSVPYVEAAASEILPEPELPDGIVAAQSGPGSVETSFANTTADAVTVVIFDEANAGHPLLTLAPGETAVLRAQPQAQLWFYDSANQAVGTSYVVSNSDGQSVTLPQAAAGGIAAGDTLLAPPVSDMKALQKAPGAIRAAIANQSGSDVTVAAIDESGAAQPIFDLKAGASIKQPLQPNTVLWFYKAGTEEVVNGPYTVASQNNQSIVIEDRALPAGPTAAQQKQSGEGSVEVVFQNTLPDDVIAAVKDEAGKVEPLFGVSAGGSVTQRVLPAAVVWFYKQGVARPVSGPMTIAGLPGEIVSILPAPEPVEDPAVVSLRATQSGPGSVELTIANRLETGVTVGVIGDDKAAVPLVDIGAGQTATQLALPGTALWFYRQDTGEALRYPLKVASAAAVSIPYDPFEAAKAEQGGPGSTDVLFANLLAYPVTVQVNRADGTRGDLLELDAGAKGVVGRAMPGTRLSFVASGTAEAVSDDYVVLDGFHGVDIPLNATQAEQAGPGSLRIRLENRSGFPLDVLTTGKDGKLDLLFDLAVDEGVVNYTRHANFQPGAEIWFMKKMTEEPVGDPFIVPQLFSGVVNIPYARQTAEALEQMGPGSIEITFANSSPDVAGVTIVNDKEERVDLIDVPANETVTTRVKPKSMLWFYKGRSDEKLGADLPYIVRSTEAQQVNLPYAPTDDELLEMTNLSIDDIMKKYIENAGLLKAESDKPQLCWKDSYGRGVGTVPRNCDPGYSEDTAGLCWPNARPGYTCDFFVCRQSTCPPGYRDDGLTCFKPPPYQRAEYPVNAEEAATTVGEGLGWFFSFGQYTPEHNPLDGAKARCKAAHGDNCVTANGDTIVYETCKAGYKQAPVITNLCTPDCAAPMTDGGIFCAKDTYTRASSLMSCDAGVQNDAGLCYNGCQAGYTGVGPVCWNACPAGLPHNCGAACTVDKAACDSALVDQVLSPVLAVGSIVLTVVTVGGSTGATAGAKAGGTAGKTAATVAAKIGAKEGVKTGLIASVKAALPQVLKTVAKEAIIDTAIGAGIGAAVYTGTGIAADVKKMQLHTKLKEIVRSRIVGEVSDERIAAIVNAMMEGAEEQAGPGVEFPWTSLDPSGIADIVIAYNHPICSDVK